MTYKQLLPLTLPTKFKIRSNVFLLTDFLLRFKIGFVFPIALAHSVWVRFFESAPQASRVRLVETAEEVNRQAPKSNGQFGFVS